MVFGTPFGSVLLGTSFTYCKRKWTDLDSSSGLYFREGRLCCREGPSTGSRTTDVTCRLSVSKGHLESFVDVQEVPDTKPPGWTDGTAGGSRGVVRDTFHVYPAIVPDAVTSGRSRGETSDDLGPDDGTLFVTRPF